MKILTFILSIYVILLSGISCADDLESSSDNITIVKAVTDQVHSDCCGDICSPFCACACCVGFTKPLATKVPALIAETIQAFTSYQQKSYFSEPIPLFQPPRSISKIS